MSTSLDTFANEKLAALERKSLRRWLAETERTGVIEVMRGGKRLISFSCNDYLNLSQHPALKRAAIAATEKWGVGAGASRLVTGNHPLYAKLEARLAALKRTAAACVFGSGYLANTGIIPALSGPDDMVCVDELAHACIHAGSALSRGAVHVFRHNDVDHLRDILRRARGKHPRALIVTDGVFSMDGDLAPIAALADAADDFDAWLMTDDAHGIGVLGDGRGSAAAQGADKRVALQMGTLSKAIGVYGGYLCASQPVIDLIRTRARPLIYSTALPPATAAAAIAALDVIAAEPDLVRAPVVKARAFTQALGLAAAESPIVPVILGGTERTMAAAKLLEDEGFLVVPIRPPTVPDGTARLRVTFTAGHDDADVARLAELIKSRVLRDAA